MAGELAWMRQAGSGSRQLANANPKRPPPRFPGRSDTTDFAKLSPGQFARHTGRASEKEAMKEGHGVALYPESRPGKYGQVPRRTGFVGRDVRVAAAALVKKGRSNGR